MPTVEPPTARLSAAQLDNTDRILKSYTGRDPQGLVETCDRLLADVRHYRKALSEVGLLTANVSLAEQGLPTLIVHDMRQIKHVAQGALGLEFMEYT